MTRSPHPRTPGRPPTAARVTLSSPLPLDLADEFGRRVLFVSADIEQFTLVSTETSVSGVDIVTVPGADIADITLKVNAIVDDEVRPQLVTPEKVVWSSSERPTTRAGVFDALLASRAATLTGEGQVALGEPLIGLFRYLDERLTAIVADRFDVSEYQYPTLVSTAALQRAGYLDSFPHHLFFVTRLHSDLDVYRAARETYADGEISGDILASCRNVDYCLPPTMCYHTFEQHRGQTLGADGLEVFTARGKSFRFEAGYAATMERLWDFTIRETVFIGRQDEILAARTAMMAAIFDLMDELGLAGQCEVGNDPFFGVDASSRVLSQRMLELKYELRLAVEHDRTIAVGSFNYHNDLFGRSFAIDHADGDPVQSGCIGFGIERLVYAFVCRHGVDPREWPIPTPI